MNAVVPRRVTVVFVGLIFATCATWWLGSESSLGGSSLRVAAALTILIAFAKILFIGRDFMELHAAPLFLRSAFNAWVGVVAAAAIVLAIM